MDITQDRWACSRTWCCSRRRLRALILSHTKMYGGGTTHLALACPEIWWTSTGLFSVSPLSPYMCVQKRSTSELIYTISGPAERARVKRQYLVQNWWLSPTFVYKLCWAMFLDVYEVWCLSDGQKVKKKLRSLYGALRALGDRRRVLFVLNAPSRRVLFVLNSPSATLWKDFEFF